LTQLKQIGTAEAYISEFQRTSVMVTNISEARLLMLYTEGLSEPLRGWVEAYKPNILQDAISWTRDLQESVSKPNFPTKFNDRRPPQRDWTGRNRLDEATRQELRKKKLCFSCQEPWVPGHRCAGKAKAHYIEVYYGSGEEEDKDE